MLENFPALQIIPLDKLVRIEWHDDQRTPPLIKRLKASGVLKNPPMVMPLNDNTGRFMVLDGTNRTTALTKMSYPHIIAQVIFSDSPNFDLKSWNHILWEYSSESFLDSIKAIPDLDIQETSNLEKIKGPWHKDILIYIQTPDKTIRQIKIDSLDLIDRVEKLNHLVNTYRTNAKFDRTRDTDISKFNNIYNNLCALVIFPPFKPQETLDLCKDGHLLPAGITRFTISPRALRVNYPLEDLASSKSLEEKNRSLEQWIQERIARKGVRHYSEPTVLFDE